MSENSQPCNIRPAVPRELPRDGVEDGASLPAHYPQHLLEPGVGSHASCKEELVLPCVREGALRDLCEHGERGLLEGVAQVLEKLAFLVAGEGFRDYPGEGEVHALDYVGKLQVVAFCREGLYPRACRELKPDLPSELVQRVPNPHIHGLPEAAVSPLGKCEHLRVRPRDVKGYRVLHPCAELAYLHVGYAVVHADQRLLAGNLLREIQPLPEAGRKAGTLGECHEINILEGALCSGKRFLEDFPGNFSVVL